MGGGTGALLNMTANQPDLMTKKKILLIGSEPWSLIYFRGDLIDDLLKNDIEVITASGKIKDAMLGAELEEQFSKRNLRHTQLPIKRRSLNPLFELICIFKIIFLLAREKPDIILAYTIKPVIWTGIVSYMFRAKFFAIITGLGSLINSEKNKFNILILILFFLYKVSLKRASGVFFQNSEDRKKFINKKILDPSVSMVVNGSGVNLKHFRKKPLPGLKRKISFLCVARLLGDKGIREYFQAASIVAEKYPEATFSLLGPYETGSDAISKTEIENWCESSFFEYLGETDDVRPFLENCHVFVLPSYHEGLPRSALEALAVGRPLIVSDIAGSRATVRINVNGLLVDAKCAYDLAIKVEWLVKNKDKLATMGESSRYMAEQFFDVKKVNQYMIGKMF